MINPHIPHYLLDSVLRCHRLPNEQPLSRAKHLVVTKFRHLHIVRQQNVLATCDLSAVLPANRTPLNASDNIVLDTRFTYSDTGQQKHLHILLLVGHQFVLITKSVAADVDRLAIAYTEADIQSFSVVPADSQIDDDLPAGQVNVRLTTTAGDSIETPLLEMTSATSSHRPESQAGSSYIGPIIRTLKQSIWTARTELMAQRLHAERLARQVGDRQRFGPTSQRGHSVDEKMMLARYGDVWWRAHRGRLVIGVPVFNCTYKRKRALLNVRLVLQAVDGTSKSPTPLQYTYQLFGCRLDASVLPSELHALLYAGDNASATPPDDEPGDPDGWPRLAFEHDWEQTYNLLPESAATIVATMDLPTFNAVSSSGSHLALHCFIVYDIEDPTATAGRHAEQLSCGTLRITADVRLSSARPTFASACCLRDLLVVAATSLMWLVDCRFESAAQARAAYSELFVAGMGFEAVQWLWQPALEMTDETVVEKDPDAMDVDRYIDDIVGSGLTLAPQQQPEIGEAARRLRVSDLFYCGTGDSFQGMLIRRHRKSSCEHELKVYASSADQLDNFLQCLRRFSGPTSVRSQQRQPADGGSGESLKRCIADEMQHLRSTDDGQRTADVGAFLRERTRLELITDVWSSRASLGVQDEPETEGWVGGRE